MPEIVSSGIESYLANLVRPRDAALAAVEADAIEHHVPMVGPVEGNVLYLLARLARARTVLELGTATGYSAIWFGRAIAPENGHFIGIEMDESRWAQAVNNLRGAGLGDISQVIQGDAFDVVPKLSEQFDLVFVDLVRSMPSPEKTMALYELALGRVRVGGLLCIDNVLHASEVLDPRSATAVGADRLNRAMASDPRLVPSILSVRDGLAVGLKTSE